MTAPSTVKPPMTPVKTAPPGVPTLGLAEAAKACGVSVSTLRRKRPELMALGAAQTGNGWHIPVTALISLGLMGRTSDAPHDSRHDTPMMPAMAAPPDALTDELEALREKLADAEKRAAVAEAVAAERERIIQAQAMSLRMLEAAKAPAQDPPTDTTSDAPAPLPQTSQEAPASSGERRWWNRLRGAR